jgi:hypothetical protein
MATGRFGAQQRKGVLLGFFAPRLLVLAITLTVTIGALFSRGLPGLRLVATFLAVPAASGFVRIGGRAAIEWAPVAGRWSVRRVMRQDIFSSGYEAAAGGQSRPFRGDAAALQVHLDPVTGAARRPRPAVAAPHGRCRGSVFPVAGRRRSAARGAGPPGRGR